MSGHYYSYLDKLKTTPPHSCLFLVPLPSLLVNFQTQCTFALHRIPHIGKDMLCRVRNRKRKACTVSNVK